MQTQILYRPVGIKELDLIAASRWKAFPPRLEWQPIFYPVLNPIYAEQIAAEWNTQDEFSGYCGIVTQFEISKAYISKYNIENVGGELHNELWVPSGELKEFNAQIIGRINVISAFFSNHFMMPDNVEIQNILMKFIK